MLIQFIIIAILFKDIALRFGLMLWDGGIVFVLLVVIAAVMTGRLVVRYRELDVRHRVAALAFSMIGALYYLSVLTFALFIFPYIPATKGGGDFDFGGDVRVVFRTDADANARAPLILKWQDAKTTDTLKLIHETSTAVFVAHPSDHGGPTVWRHIVGADNRPAVLVINKQLINTIVFVHQ